MPVKCTHPEPPGPDSRNYTEERDGFNGFSTYYPQMGGYGAKCIVRLLDDGCFDVWVWHDGEFPFDGDGETTVGEPGHRCPAFLHHCDPTQFVEFGRQVIAHEREAIPCR